MKTIRMVILDDNLDKARNYEKICRELGEKQNIILESKLYNSCKTLEFDLYKPIFCKRLDMILFNLSEKNTLEAALEFRKMGYIGLIIFLGEATREPDCEKVFDAKSFNFVKMKKESVPVDFERFSEVLKQSIETIKKNNAESLLLTYGGEIKQIDIDDVLYFNVVDKTITVYYGQGETYSFISSLSKIEARLRGYNFVRASRASLVSVKMIESLTHSDVLLKDGTTVDVGRQCYKGIKNAMEEQEGGRL
jgi:DNA-binding LytR/AlgR family response regulator